MATARAKVAVFSSIREAPLDESEEDDEQNVEADDEGDGGENVVKDQPEDTTDDPASIQSSTEDVSAVGSANSIDAPGAEDISLAGEAQPAPGSTEQPAPSATEDIHRAASPSQQTDSSSPLKESETTQDTGPSSSAEGSIVPGWWRSTNNATQLQYPL